MNKPKVLSFFSGALGLDIGLEQAGFEIVSMCENDSACYDTIMANRSHINVFHDINDIKIKDLSSFKDVVMICGGPNCQPFSTAGKRKGFNDERGASFLKFLDIISHIKPRYILIENVRGLLSAKMNDIKGGVMDHILDILKSVGYNVSYNLYNTANYGVAQARERVIIIGTLDKTKVPFLSPTHSDVPKFNLLPRRTLKDEIYGIHTSYSDYVGFSLKHEKYYEMLKSGQNWRNLPEDIQKEAMGKAMESGGGRTGYFRKLDWDKPSPCLITTPWRPMTALCHPDEVRPLSVQEYRKLQGFPSEWKLCGTLIQKYRQVGNAVPIQFAKIIGETILNHSNGIIVEPPVGFRFSRYKV